MRKRVHHVNRSAGQEIAGGGCALWTKVALNIEGGAR
jgi:hypothetical protein